MPLTVIYTAELSRNGDEKLAGQYDIDQKTAVNSRLEWFQVNKQVVPIMAGSRSSLPQSMLEVIDQHFRATAVSTGKWKLSPAIRDAIAATPRDQFVPAALQPSAYTDSALPIGCKQTISQPFIVALMTELLEPEAQDKVLEIGTGSGYQAAVLARLVSHVYSMEIVEPLARLARECLQAIEVDNVSVVAGNGAEGLPQYAPFDKVIITAASPEIPAAIVAQLRPGGRIVVPLGEAGYGQQLAVLEKTAGGELQRRDVLAVTFVPFTGR
jgi:protein-L-isoaspartate(D-aspartate) O-methyltransferase